MLLIIDIVASNRLIIMRCHMQIWTAENRKPNVDEFLLDVQLAVTGWPWYHKDPYIVRIITVSAFFFTVQYLSNLEEVGILSLEFRTGCEICCEIPS